MKPINRLMLIAGGGFVACFGIAEIFKRHVSEKIHNSAVFQEAMNMLRENRGAKYLLGYPIENSRASFSSPGLNFSDHSAIKVFVHGPKSGGIVFITSKPDKEKKMQLDTVQLQVGRDDSKRLVIKKASDQTSSAS